MLIASNTGDKARAPYQSKRWTITFWPEKTKKTPKQIYEENEIMTFMIYGEELCPQTKRLHYQMYVEMEKRRVLSTMQDMFGMGHFIQASRGSWRSNVMYTSKDGNVTRYGEPMTNGSSAEIVPMAKRLLSGEITVADAIEEHPGMYHQYKHTISKYMESKGDVKRTWKPEVNWLWGPTLTGKSGRVWDKYPDLFCYDDGMKGWWDGYNGQETVLLDDFRGNSLPYSFVLRLLDRYPMRVNVKGSSVSFRPKRIFITSCYPPDKCYKGKLEKGDDITQLLRRIDNVTYTGEKVDDEPFEEAEWGTHIDNEDV